jgi:hypothetical protein
VDLYIDQHYFSFEKFSGTQRVTQNLFGEGGVSYTDVRKKGSRMSFQLASFSEGTSRTPFQHIASQKLPLT